MTDKTSKIRIHMGCGEPLRSRSSIAPSITHAICSLEKNTTASVAAEKISASRSQETKQKS